MKNPKLLLVLTCLLSFAYSCNRSKEESGLLAVPVENHAPQIKYADLLFEEVVLDSIHCSYNGISGVSPDGKLYYFDQHFGYCHFFDSDGKLVDRRLGVGRSDSETEIRGLSGISFSDEGRFVRLGTTNDFEIFDSDFSTKKSFRLPFKESDLPEDPGTYSYYYEDLVCRMHGDMVYIGCYSEDPSFNSTTSGKEFLLHSRHIARIDTETQSESMILEGSPRTYHKLKERSASFILVYFDISHDGVLYVGFEADSLLYQCDLNGVPQKAFGNAGSEMDTDYLPFRSFENPEPFLVNREEKGYYNWVEYVDETGLLFRSYKKGLGKPDGLLIYKDGVLVGDVEVPQGMRVKGYIEPYYFSQIFEDDENESLKVFRFTL